MTLLFLVGLFSLCVGSFLNVCIYRIPRGQSFVRPRSHCPHCGRFLKWFHNIPIFSFLFLRGRCAFCRKPISWQYPLVEGLTLLLAGVTVLRFGFSLESLLLFCTFVAPLIVISFIDLEHRLIPDSLSLPGIPVGFVVHLLVSGLSPVAALIDSALGVLMGGGFLYLVGTVYEKIRKQEGLGGGDLKLAAALGAFLGWQGVLFVLPLAAFAGMLVGLTLMLFFRKGLQYQLPYGPFLAGAGLLMLFYGEELIHLYFDIVL